MPEKTIKAATLRKIPSQGWRLVRAPKTIPLERRGWHGLGAIRVGYDIFLAPPAKCASAKLKMSLQESMQRKFRR